MTRLSITLLFLQRRLVRKVIWSRHMSSEINTPTTSSVPTAVPRAKEQSGQRQGGPGRKPKQSGGKTAPNQVNAGAATKLRGLPTDSVEVRVSKTVSWLLRHAAEKEGLVMRKDGYVKVDDLLANSRVKALDVTLDNLKKVVKTDAKNRFDLILENDVGEKLLVDLEASSSAETVVDAPTGTWWIKANQGHSIKAVELELKPLLSVADIPTGIAVHGTTRAAWEAIRTQGLSKMKRNHIHLAQGVSGSGVVSGMRNSSQIYIYVDVEKALAAGLKFSLSNNGVVLTEGNDEGILLPEFFSRVQDNKGHALPGWEGPETKAG